MSLKWKLRGGGKMIESDHLCFALNHSSASLRPNHYQTTTAIFHFFVSPSKKFQAQITATIVIMIRMTPCKEITLKGNIVSILNV